jgi:hypothetical protein
MKLPAVLPDSFLKALPEPERRKLGKAGITAEEAIVAYSTKKERELQRLVHNWLLSKELYFESDRMDKRTSGKKGRADFRVCCRGLWLSLECKAGTGTLTSEQGAEAARLRRSGGKFVVVRSLEEAVEAVNGMRGF